MHSVYADGKPLDRLKPKLNADRKRYISLASGNMCHTYARKTRHGDEAIIVCIDFKERENEDD